MLGAPVHVQDEAPARVGGGHHLAGVVFVAGGVVVGEGLGADAFEEVVGVVGGGGGDFGVDRFGPPWMRC